jgi:hypothetical protein
MQALSAKPPSPADRERVADEIRKAVDACKAGEKGAIDRLRALGREHPSEVVAMTSADFSDLARLAVVKMATGDRPELAALGEGVLVRLDQLTAELAGPDPSPVRRLVARHAAFDEVTLGFMQLMVTAAKSPSPALVGRLNSAHRRMMASARTLGQIARFERPRLPSLQAIQINIERGDKNPTGHTGRDMLS